MNDEAILMINHEVPAPNFRLTAWRVGAVRAPLHPGRIMRSATLTTRGAIQTNTRLPEDDVKLTYSAIGLRGRLSVLNIGDYS